MQGWRGGRCALPLPGFPQDRPRRSGKRAWRGAACALVTRDGFSAASGLLESDLHMARLKRAKGVERSVRAADAPGPAAIMDAGPG